MTNLRVAVVGAGVMGTNHLRVYERLKSVDLVAVVDDRLERAQVAANRYGCRAFASAQDLPNGVDAVSIAVPSSLHAEVGKCVLERGIPCLIEKPLATNRSDAVELIETAQRNRTVLMVGHVERFNPAVVALADICARTRVHAVDVRRLSAASPRIVDVDVVLDLMVHDIDLVLSIINGALVHVGAEGLMLNRGYGVDYASALLRFDGPALASLTASRITQDKVREMHVTSDLGFIRLNFMSQTLSIQREGRVLPTLGQQSAEGSMALDVSAETLLIRNEEPLLLELQHFVDIVRHGGPPKVAGTDALRALDVVWEIQRQIHESPLA